MEIIVTRDKDGRIDFWERDSNVHKEAGNPGVWYGGNMLTFGVSYKFCKFLLGEIPRKGSKTTWILK